MMVTCKYSYKRKLNARENAGRKQMKVVVPSLPPPASRHILFVIYYLQSREIFQVYIYLLIIEEICLESRTTSSEVPREELFYTVYHL
jgi:hypothetical protein